MNYVEIKNYDIANGPGVRVSLFVSGCRHHCKECFNPETWNFNYGKLFDESVEEMIFSLLDKPFISGLTLLGGDPFEPENSKMLNQFVKKSRVRFPEKSIWCYTGYLYEDLLKSDRDSRELLSNLDVLVDGEFVLELKSLMLKFRGSSNQRLIDVPASLSSKQVLLWDK